MGHEILVLANGEKDKGYWKGTCFSEMGRRNIRAGFLIRFGLNLPWGKFKTRLEHLRRQYDIYKRVTKNATGLSFTEFSEIDMSADWWDQLIKVLFNKLIVTDISSPINMPEDSQKTHQTHSSKGAHQEKPSRTRSSRKKAQFRSLGPYHKYFRKSREILVSRSTNI